MRTILSLAILVSLVAPVSRAAGDDDEDVVTAPVQVNGLRDPADDGDEPRAAGAERALDEPAFTTVIELDRARDETVSIAEALAETVGVSIRSLGGLGAFASLSMRGAPAGQTEILIDGVPLSRVAFSSVDLGSFDVAGFDRVEVLRGGVPAELGGAVLGGAVNFVTRVGPLPTGEHTTLTLAGGSFGARRLRATRGDAFGARGELETGLSVSYAGASGDFRYFDDNGTPFNRDDDAMRERQNNDFDAVDVAARAKKSGPLALVGGARASWKGQGVPGPSGAHATMPDLATLRVVGDAGVERRGLARGALTVGGRGFVIFERQRYRDLAAEINLTPTDLSFTTRGGGAALSGAWTPSARHRLTALVDGRAELLARVDERDPAAEGATGRRLGAGASLAWEMVLGEDEALVVVPAARIDLLTTRGEGSPSTVFGGRPLAARDDVYVTPRVAARWRLSDGVALKASAGRYFRPPTVIELFGDRGFVAGNPALRPETGTSGDVGVVLAPARAFGVFDQLYLETALFGSMVSDLILFLPTAARSARAGNVADARLAGLEVAAHARLARTVTLTGNYTFLESEQRAESVVVDGKRLPGRPRHELYLRLDVARRLGATRASAGVFADLTLVSGNFLDEGNLNEVPARRLVGLGVRVSPVPALSLVAQVKNLTNHHVEDVGAPGREVPRAVADVLDFPLPGRAYYLSLDLSF